LTYLVDTNVLSEALRPIPEPRVAAWLKSTDESRLFLSAITIAELRRGICTMPDGKRKHGLMAWLDDDICLRFKDRLLSVDVTVANFWGRMSASEKARGNNVGPMDVFIAATALVHDLTVATRNSRDFEPLGVPVFNPWVA
jgi:toxin FitB